MMQRFLSGIPGALRLLAIPIQVGMLSMMLALGSAGQQALIPGTGAASCSFSERTFPSPAFPIYFIEYSEVKNYEETSKEDKESTRYSYAGLGRLPLVFPGQKARLAAQLRDGRFRSLRLRKYILFHSLKLDC